MRPDDGAVEAITPALRALAEELRPDLLLAPQAVGGHVDHLAVVHALSALALPPRVGWWRDAPYAWRPDRAHAPFASRFPPAAQPPCAATPAAQATKVEAVLAYTTQLGFQFGGPEAARETLAGPGAREVLWWSPEAGAHA